MICRYEPREQLMTGTVLEDRSVEVAQIEVLFRRRKELYGKEVFLSISLFFCCFFFFWAVVHDPADFSPPAERRGQRGPEGEGPPRYLGESQSRSSVSGQDMLSASTYTHRLMMRNIKHSSRFRSLSVLWWMGFTLLKSWRMYAGSPGLKRGGGTLMTAVLSEISTSSSTCGR